MIKENGVWKCDYCDRESGEYYRETGNHVDCQDRAKSVEIARLRAENARLVSFARSVAGIGEIEESGYNSVWDLLEGLKRNANIVIDEAKDAN